MQQIAQKKVISVLNCTLTQETDLFPGYAYLEVEFAIWLMSSKGARVGISTQSSPYSLLFQVIDGLELTAKMNRINFDPY